MKQKWASSTVGRILGNEKYVGKWVWNKSESPSRPQNRAKTPIPKPESEWITTVDESLRIVSQDLWDDVQLRRESMKNHGLAGTANADLKARKAAARHSIRVIFYRGR